MLIGDQCETCIHRRKYKMQHRYNYACAEKHYDYFNNPDNPKHLNEYCPYYHFNPMGYTL